MENPIEKFTNISKLNDNVEYIDENGTYWRMVISVPTYLFYKIDGDSVIYSGSCHADAESIDRMYLELFKSNIEICHDDFLKYGERKEIKIK